MKDNVVLIKSEDFSVRILSLYESFRQNHVPYPVIEQIIKSSTSIGANLNEATCAISESDFLSKVYISFKECSETKYWLRLLYKSKYISEDLYLNLYNQCEEIYKILASITKSLKSKKTGN